MPTPSAPVMLTMPSSRRFLVLLPALFCAIAACAEDRPAPAVAGVTNLLGRGPDEVLDQPGAIGSIEDVDWNETDFNGWDSEPLNGAMWSRDLKSRIPLMATLPADRTISLDLIAPTSRRDPDTTTFVRVFLNGRVIGTSQLTHEVATYDFEAPADAWFLGRNLLELEASRVTPTPDGRFALGIAGLRYGERAEVRWDDGKPRLDPGTGVRYRLMSRSPGTLALSGSTTGSGELFVVTREVDIASGGVLRGSDPEPLAVASDAPLDRVLPLPTTESGLLEVELLWLGAPESRLTIDRLDWGHGGTRETPPIIFLSIDTLSARHMSVYGYERATTPNLERFATEAITFDQCRSNAPRTMASYLSQFTGLFPTSNRPPSADTASRWLLPREENQMTPNRTSLAEALRALGYRTAAWIDNPLLARTPGITQGFDLYDPSASEIDHYTAGPEALSGGIELVIEQALDWLEKVEDGGPFFCLLQALDVHSPYVCEEPWLGTFREDDLPDRTHTAPTSLGQPDVFGQIQYGVASALRVDGKLPDELPTASIIDSYDEAILEVDAHIAGFFEDLKKLGLYDRSIIVLSADHGESMLEHDFFFGHGTLNIEALHVPLMIRLPGGAHGGRRIETPVQLVDLFPTLIELAGGDSTTIETHGRSLVSALEGEELARVPLVSEGGVLRASAIEADGWRLIVSRALEGPRSSMITHPLIRDELVKRAPRLGDRDLDGQDIKHFFAENPDIVAFIEETLGEKQYELYDLTNDPNELNNVAEKYPDKVAKLEALLEKELERAHAARARADFATLTDHMSEEELERLRDLGYLGK